MKILVLDDDVRRHSGFARALQPNIVHHVYDYHRACRALSSERYDLVYLDHDLNDFGKRSMAPGMYGINERELTGVDVAAFIATLPEDRIPKKVIVHTWNPDGGKRMMQVLQEICPASFEPFQAPKCGRCGEGLEQHSGDNRAHMRCALELGDIDITEAE